MAIILSNLNRFERHFSPENSGKFGKFVIKWILQLPNAYVATLPCETLMSAKHAINDKLQGSVATYLGCDGVVDNQIKQVYC